MKEKAESSVACNHHRVGFLGLLVTLGIVFGDIGTSPLYVMKAILHTGESISESTILGALSCIIWTLTLQTTIKYVCVALRADNNGEGGILALYALLRRLKSKWIYLLAIIGASTLLADGIITPAITVTTAIEGLESISPNLPVIPITLAIITIIFFVQRFGTESIGKSFGVFMLLWFLLLGVVGAFSITSYPLILKAFNPYYAAMLLAKSPRVFKTTWKGMLAVALGCAALCGAMKYDLFGVTRHIPAPDSVKLVNVYAAGSNYYLTPGKDDVLIEKVRTLHQTIIDDKDYIQKEAPGYGYYSDGYTASVEESAEDSGAQSTITHVRITYMLNSGLKVERGYRLYLTPDRMAREGTYDYLLDQLINSPEMRQKRIRWRDEGFQMTEAWFETWSGGGTLGSREAGLLLDAVAKDAENGDWGVYNWFLADNDADNYDLRIQFEYKLPESQFNRIHDTIRINVKEGMTETIRALKDLKLITDADLVTNRERYPWQYAAGGWDQYDQFYGQFHMSPEEYYERYSEYPAGWFGTESDELPTETENAPAVDDSHSPSMSDGAEATSFGIIGGADGPTVMVTTVA